MLCALSAKLDTKYKFYPIRIEPLFVTLLVSNLTITTLHWLYQITNIGYCNAERYKCPPNEQYKY